MKHSLIEFNLSDGATEFEDCEFRQQSDMSADGATQVASGTNRDLCLGACRANAACRAVEYSTANGCWMHTSDAYMAIIKANTGVTMYERVRCGGR